MGSGLVWTGVFFAVLGAWYALDTASASRRWSLRKRDLLSSLSEPAYIRFTRATGAASFVLGLVLIVFGWTRAA